MRLYERKTFINSLRKKGINPPVFTLIVHDERACEELNLKKKKLRQAEENEPIYFINAIQRLGTLSICSKMQQEKFHNSLKQGKGSEKHVTCTQVYLIH
jgi:hypothetical protein